MGGCRDGLEGGMGPKQAFSGGVPAVSEAEVAVRLRNVGRGRPEVTSATSCKIPAIQAEAPEPPFRGFLLPFNGLCKTPKVQIEV